MILKNYIDSHIRHVNKNNIPQQMDLVLDGGAFNGIYMLGCLYYLKRIEELKMTNVYRISGCSIGAVLGVFYIMNKLEHIEFFGNLTMKNIRSRQNLKNSIKKFRKIIEDLLVDYDISLFNNRLYITYFSVKKNKQIIKSKYKSKEDLINTIIYSLSIPFLVHRRPTCNNCIDGLFPYIFKKRYKNRKMLFINLLTFDKIKNIIYIKGEENLYNRIIYGIVHMHKLFNHGESRMCSFIDEWSIIEITGFRLREIIFYVLFYFFTYGYKMIDYIPLFVKDNSLSNKLINILINLWDDLIIYLTF
jgi:hypothetical protein